MPLAPRNEAPKALLALLAVQLLFGVHYSAAREITARLDPAAWTLLRQAGGALLLLACLLIARRPLPRAGWPRLFALSLLGVAINQLIFNAGMSRTTALHAVVVTATIPGLTLAFGALLGEERLSPRKLVSVALGALGVAVLLEIDHLAGATGSLWRTRDGAPAGQITDTILFGDLLILTNSACYALYLVLSKKTSQEIDPLPLAAALFLGALPVTALVGAPALRADQFAALPPAIWALAVGVIVGPTVLAYLLNLYALRRLSPSLVGLFINLQFVVAALVAALWHDERLTARLGAAALLVLAGLSLRFLPERRARAS